MLKCLDLVKPYHIDRVLRQFGLIQYISSPPLPPQKCLHGALPNQYWVEYPYINRMWQSWDNHVLSSRARSSEVAFPGDCILEYLHWYTRVSHPYVQNPEFRSTYNVVQSSNTSAPSMPADPRHICPLGLLDPIVKCSVGSTPPDDMFYAIKETIHLLCNIVLDLATAPADPQAPTAPAAYNIRTIRTFFRKHHNDRN